MSPRPDVDQSPLTVRIGRLLRSGLKGTGDVECFRLRAYCEEREKKSGSKRCLYQQLCQLFLRRQMVRDAEAVLAVLLYHSGDSGTSWTSSPMAFCGWWVQGCNFLFQNFHPETTSLTTTYHITASAFTVEALPTSQPSKSQMQRQY